MLILKFSYKVPRIFSNAVHCSLWHWHSRRTDVTVYCVWREFLGGQTLMFTVYAGNLTCTKNLPGCSNYIKEFFSYISNIHINTSLPDIIIAVYSINYVFYYTHCHALSVCVTWQTTLHFLPNFGKASYYPVGLLTIKSGFQTQQIQFHDWDYNFISIKLINVGSTQNEVKK